MLETREKLTWKARGNDLIITTPEFDPNRIESRYAYVFRLSSIEPQGR